MREAVKPMIKQKYGRIINISSVVGMMGVIGTPYYATTKAGLLGLTRAAAAETAKHNITVNAINVGYVETGLGLELNETMKKHISSQIPVGRFANPTEIAYAVTFLASEKASYITGTAINVSGGLYM